jgi:trehalose/maltose hydrolase-like predicted phosphorylase
MMTAAGEDRPGRASEVPFPPELTRPFWVIACDWDGTLGADRQESVGLLRQELEALLRLGICIAVIGGADFPTIDRQLSAAIHGAHKRHLFVLSDCGSVAHSFDRRSDPVLLWRRSATTPEVELTGNSDAITWVVRELVQRRHLPHERILIVEGEFGALCRSGGRDHPLLTPHGRGAVVVSVGHEPAGVPEGVLHLGGGPAGFQALLRAQIAAHWRLGQQSSAAAPETMPDEFPVTPTPNPAWLLIEEGVMLAREHEIESLFTVANGRVGTRGALDEGSSRSAPATYVAGVFGLAAAQGAVSELIPVPDWTHLRLAVNGQQLTLEGPGTLDHRRLLDLHQGIFWREWRHRDPAGRITRLCFLRLVSLADRHVLVQSVTLTAENYSGQVRLESGFRPTASMAVPSQPAPTAAPGASPANALRLEVRAPGTGTVVALVTMPLPHTDGSGPLTPEIQPAQGGSLHRYHLEVDIGKTWRLDRLLCVYTSREVVQPTDAALAHLERLLADGGVPAVIEAHRQAWGQRWQATDVQVDDDPEAQRALRFAAYHLISAANPEDERVSVGARALTGKAYKGHVFWDTEIFLLPFYMFTHPATARALLMYRYHTLPAARDKARALGYRGALYAWESADDGRETTPTSVHMPDGEVVHILTGEQEHHISADVAYAVWQYWQATGDDAFFLEAGAEILLETARFWASRVHLGPEGRYHIARVIGPDEYHEGVDDNAYTNVMAQWTLERGAEAARLLQERWPRRGIEVLARLQVGPAEPEQWRLVAHNLYTGFDPRTGLFEQFRGYFDLEPIDLAAYEPRTAPIDVLLGRQRTQRSQVIKQADVIMLLALLWERFPPSVREANFRYYEPRTAHGSSLSPAVHALVAARLGDIALAERYFRQGASIDLANNMGNAAGGIHIAALGGLWQAAVLGCAGMTLQPDGLGFAPSLPQAWRQLRFPVRWRGRALTVTLGQEPRTLTLELVGPEPMTVAVLGGPQVSAVPGRRYKVRWKTGGWEAWQEVAYAGPEVPP